MHHYTSMIHSHGSAGGYNTEASERLHINYAKIAYNASNKKGYMKQMTVWMRRHKAVEKFQRFLQYAINEYTEPEAEEEMEEEENNVDIDGDINSHTSNDRKWIGHVNPAVSLQNYHHKGNNDDDADGKDIDIAMKSQLEYGESTCFIPKTLSYANVSLDDLQTKFGASEFVYAMEAFLHKHQLFSLDYWDAEPAAYLSI